MTRRADFLSVVVLPHVGFLVRSLVGLALVGALVAGAGGAAGAPGVLVDTVVTDQPLGAEYVDIERWTFGPGPGFVENADILGTNGAVLVTAGRLTATASRPARWLPGADDAAPRPVAAGLPPQLPA